MRDHDDRRVELGSQAPDQVEDLRLGRHVERGRRLVGDQQRRVVRPAPSRSSRAGACRPTTRAGSSSGARSALGMPTAVEHVDGAGRAPAALVTSWWRWIASSSCQPIGVDRVQRRHRVLEDHRDLVAADLAQLRLGQARAGRGRRTSTSPDVAAVFGRSPMIVRLVTDLPEPDSPTMPSTLPRSTRTRRRRPRRRRRRRW